MIAQNVLAQQILVTRKKMLFSVYFVLLVLTSKIAEQYVVLWPGWTYAVDVSTPKILSNNEQTKIVQIKNSIFLNPVFGIVHKQCQPHSSLMNRDQNHPHSLMKFGQEAIRLHSFIML